MGEHAVIPPGEITFTERPGGEARVDLVADGRSVSRLYINRFTIRVGAATVRMDGIGGVSTEKECRRQGYARRVLEASVQHMQAGDAALAMLYGIPDFYPKFGFATAGPDHFTWLTGSFEGAALPPGWKVRRFTRADLPVLHRLYEQNTAQGVGAAVRAPGAHPWSVLLDPEKQGLEECRLVEDSAGQVRAYAWRAKWHWYVGIIERDQPDAFVISEVMADSPSSADAALAACRQWAAEESGKRTEPVKRCILSLPPEGPVAAAAMRQSATFVRRFVRCGSSMARVLHVGRLLRALQPELARRLQAAGSHYLGTLHFQTEIGGACLTIRPEGISVAESPEPAGSQPACTESEAAAAAPSPAERIEVRLPQADLARLALGVFPPDDSLARLENPPGEEARQLLGLLFPLRHPHMYLPDRF